MTNPPKIVVTRRLDPNVERRLAEEFGAQLNPEDEPFEAEKLKAALSEADILVPTVTDQLDSRTLAAAGPQLRLIANFGVGTDNIDVAAADARGIAVTNTPDVLTDDTADLAIALMLMVRRRLLEGALRVRNGAWHGWAPTDGLGRSLAGQCLGIIGMGRIGQATARRAAGLGMTIHYYSRSRLSGGVERALQARWHDRLESLLATADIVSLHCPANPQTRNLIDASALETMKTDAILINTARGSVVDEAALIAALAAGTIGGAGLDVFENEPYVPPALRGCDRVVALPHLGSATVETRRAMAEKVYDNICAHLAGAPLPDRVAPPDRG